jgi:hypothetical protein
MSKRDQLRDLPNVGYVAAYPDTALREAAELVGFQKSVTYVEQQLYALVRTR